MKVIHVKNEKKQQFHAQQYTDTTLRLIWRSVSQAQACVHPSCSRKVTTPHLRALGPAATPFTDASPSASEQVIPMAVR